MGDAFTSANRPAWASRRQQESRGDGADGRESRCNAIRAIHPDRHEGLWVFDDETAGLRQEPFVSGADAILTGSPPKKGTGHLLARK